MQIERSRTAPRTAPASHVRAAISFQQAVEGMKSLHKDRSSAINLVQVSAIMQCRTS